MIFYAGLAIGIGIGYAVGYFVYRQKRGAHGRFVK